MAGNLQNNPFAGLFSSLEAAKEFSEKQQLNVEDQQEKEKPDPRPDICLPGKQDGAQSGAATSVSSPPPPPRDKNSEKDSALLEYLLQVTVTDPPCNTWHSCVLMPPDTGSMNQESINMILFERLLLEQPYTIVQNDSSKSTAVKGSSRGTVWSTPCNTNELLRSGFEVQVLFYLVGVFERCAAARRVIKSSKKDRTAALKIVESVEFEVLTNFHTAVHQPELYESQDVQKQLNLLLVNDLANSEEFDELIFRYVKKTEEEETELPKAFAEILAKVEHSLHQCDLYSVEAVNVQTIEFFAKSPSLAAILLTVPAPGSRSLGSAPRPPGAVYQQTALGRLLAVSCLPKAPNESTRFFSNADRLTKSQVLDENLVIARQQARLHESCYDIFRSLLSNKSSKHQLLLWLEGCLASNHGRSGLWHVTGGGAMTASQYVSDGFMLNLGAVLAKLAHKFTEDIIDGDGGLDASDQPRIMQVDPSYCFSAANEGPPGSYPASLSSLTMLVPHQEADNPAVPPFPKKYTFVTSCFFFANCALHLGLNVLNQRLTSVQQELGRLHRESGNLPSDIDPRVRAAVRQRIAAITSTYLTLRAAMLPQAHSLPVNHLLAATAHWLVQICQSPVTPWDSCPRPTLPVQTPIPEFSLACAGEDSPSASHEPSWLQFVPELLVNNLTHLPTLSRMLSADDNSALFDLPINRRLLTFIIVYMGSAGRIKNPHLRAELAQTLELLLLGEPLSSAADVDKESSHSKLLPAVWDALVVRHPLACHLPTAVVRVFVSIEMTGQSVSFEDKFKYRGPMYEILKHLWQLPCQRQVLIELCNEALDNMESTRPPLLLRFVNLLINDNIFLLDEGLAYMAQIKEMQLEKERGEWEALTPAGRKEKESQLHHTTMLARFHNVLGRRTAATLLMLSEESALASLLCHKTLVERVAAMLNFVLDHLVGPKQRNLKVRDTDQFEFRPSVLVTAICRMYCNLRHQSSFAGAVIADGRSYSPALLGQAMAVLGRIGEQRVSEELELVQRQVTGATQSQEEEEDLTAAAPEKFLDPIMSILMRDPVRLPSSGTIVERATIARHLLSDQSDPFNRQPLTMDQVIPATELRQEILDWINSTKEKKLKQQQEEQEQQGAVEASTSGISSTDAAAGADEMETNDADASKDTR